MTSGRARGGIPRADREQFLAALRSGWSVTHAAAQTPHARQRYYELRDADEAFAEVWAQAVDEGADRLEDEAVRRALEGYDEDTVDGEGRLLRRVRKYDSPLLQLLLKAKRPRVFREQSSVEVTGPEGEPIAVDHRTGLTLEGLAEFAAGLREAQRPDRSLSPALDQMRSRSALSPGSPAPAQTHQGGEVHAKTEPPLRDGTLQACCRVPHR